MSSISESTASIRNPFISLILSCPVSVSSFPCSPIDRPRPDSVASGLISCDESYFPLDKNWLHASNYYLQLREKLFYLTPSEKLAKVLYDLQTAFFACTYEYSLRT